MSHDSSEPKSIIEEIQDYEFEESYQDDFDDDDFEDDVYTDEGEIRHKFYATVRKETSIQDNQKDKSEDQTSDSE